MTTLGARGWPILLGVPEPEGPAVAAGAGFIMPWGAPNICPPLADVEVAGGVGCNVPTVGWVPSMEGALLRASARCVCDEVGVGWAELEGEAEAP